MLVLSKDQQSFESDSDMYTDEDEDDDGEAHQDRRTDGPTSLRRINDRTKITVPMVSATTATTGSNENVGESSAHSTHMSNEFRRSGTPRSPASNKRNDGSRRASNYNDVHIQVSEQLMQYEEKNQQQELNDYRPMGVVGYVWFLSRSWKILSLECSFECWNGEANFSTKLSNPLFF